ncbi:MAG: GIY-YIG nuclease family protein [Alphaproteobacteria bacterium]
MKKQPAVYIMANGYRGTLYVGVTSSLTHRVFQHREAEIKGSFTEKYGCKNLVYYEFFETMFDAITREKQLKGGSRQKKIELIAGMNPDWKDLYEFICY